IQRAVVVPKREVAIHRAARGQILRDRAPLAARAQHVHQAVDHVADAHRSLATPALRRWNDRCDESPFLVCQVAGIAKLAAVISTAVLVRPHRRYPANRADAIESQVIPTIQDVFGRTLRKAHLIEAELLRREAVLRSILDTVPDALVIVGETGTIQSFSAAAARLFCRTQEEVIGAHVRMLIPAYDEYVTHYLRTGERRISGVGRNVVALRNDGG